MATSPPPSWGLRENVLANQLTVTVTTEILGASLILMHSKRAMNTVSVLTTHRQCPRIVLQDGGHRC